MVGRVDLRLVPRVQQRLAPQLRLMYGVYSQSTEELIKAIEEEMMANPVLENASDRSDPGAAEQLNPEPPLPPADAAEWSLDPRMVWRGPAERSLVALEKPEEREFNGVVAPPPTLADHLATGVRLTVNDPRLRQLALAIVGELDDDGYLREPLDEIAARYGVSAEDALHHGPAGAQSIQ